MIGRTLSHYRILHKLGSGGMGDVYLAEDTRLSRKIALKVLPPEMASSERRHRFEREAKAVAALNHPNIVHLYSVEEAEGVNFITMELVRGRTLRELLPRNGFALSKFFDLAIPLAGAVAAAHEEGITHRDLKPENVMLTDDGRVKVLDFGLAKGEESQAESRGSELATQERLTQDGTVLGTLSYMSPELAEGKAADRRSDIFSLGIVFYEILAGERPFRGDSPAAILSAILKDVPRSLEAVNPLVPRELARIVRRCLVKAPDRRFQSTKDLAIELDELREMLTTGELEPSTAPRRWSLLAVVAVSLALFAGWIGYLLRGESDRGVARVVNPVQITVAAGVEDYPTWSPDGRTLAYHSNQSGNQDIWVAQVGGSEAVNRTREHLREDSRPSWSPDGSQIGFHSSREGGGYFVMSALGGTPRKVLSAGTSHRPQWSSDGTQLAGIVQRESDSAAVEIVSIANRAVSQISLPRAVAAFDLAWSRNKGYFAYVETADYEAEVTQLVVLRISDGTRLPITHGRDIAWSPAWAVNDHALLFVSNRGGSMDLWQQPVARDGRPVGQPQRLTTGVGMRRLALSADGKKVAYTKGNRVSNIFRVPILAARRATWDDAEQITFDQAYIEFFDLSADGKQLVLSSDRSGNQDIWSLSAEGGAMESLSSDPTPDWAPRFSPDGDRVAFYSFRSGNRDVWTMPARGGPARRITDHDADDMLPEWSPDGRTLAFVSLRSGNLDLWTVPSEGGNPRRLTTHPAQDAWIKAWASDGQTLFFSSNRSGEWGVWRISAEGGEPDLISDRSFLLGHSPDRRNLYVRRDNDIVEIDLDGSRERILTNLSGRIGGLTSGNGATDGRHFYFLWREDQSDIWVMDVVTDGE